MQKERTIFQSENFSPGNFRVPARHSPERGYARCEKFYCNFSVAKLNSAKTIAMIQNRIVTFVSGQPSS